MNFFCYNDWIVKDVLSCSTDILYGGKFVESKLSVYKILYSPSRNKYKLKCSGYKYKNKPIYAEALLLLSKYQNENISECNKNI